MCLAVNRSCGAWSHFGHISYFTTSAGDLSAFQNQRSTGHRNSASTNFQLSAFSFQLSAINALVGVSESGSEVARFQYAGSIENVEQVNHHRPTHLGPFSYTFVMMMAERSTTLPSSSSSSSAPSLSSDPFLSHLHSRLTEAEHAFLLADFHTAATQSQDILHALITLTSSFSSPAPLLPPTHSCTVDCVCAPAFLLLLQSTLQSTPASTASSTLTTLVSTYYQSPTRLPFDVLLAVSWWQVRSCQYELVVQQAVGWLEARKRDNERVKDSEYVALLELVVLYALCPLGEYSEAAMLVRRSERLGKERREAWLKTVRQMEEQHLGTATTKTAQATAGASAATMPSQQQLLPPIEERKEDEHVADGKASVSGQAAVAVVPFDAAPSSFTALLFSLHTRLLLRLHALSPTLAWQYQQLLSALSLHRRVLVVCLVVLLLWRYRSAWSGTIERPLQRLQQSPVWSGLRAELGNLAQLALSSGFGRLFW